MREDLSGGQTWPCPRIIGGVAQEVRIVGASSLRREPEGQSQLELITLLGLLRPAPVRRRFLPLGPRVQLERILNRHDVGKPVIGF